MIGVFGVSSQNSIGGFWVWAFQIHSGWRDDYSVDEVDVLIPLHDLLGILGSVVVVRIGQFQEFIFERFDGVSFGGIGTRDW